MIHLDPWAPFVPSHQDAWDLAKVAHLHRRAGFGSNRSEQQRDLDAGMQVSVERLLKPPAASSADQRVMDTLLRGAVTSWDSGRLQAWWLHRMLWGNDPLREKMTLFWHSHFATSERKVQELPLMASQNQLLRQQALGDFADLLRSIVADPAMLIWLDGAKSQQEKPNENFAREFLELFTLGTGHYTEGDIQQAARAFTGWSLKRGPDRDVPTISQFDPQRFDDGPKTFLGQSGPWNTDDIVRITLEQPAASQFLCKKLYRFLVSDAVEPAPELIEPLSEQFRGSGYSIGHLVAVILRSRHFYSTEVRWQKVASPVEFSVGIVRSLECSRSDISLLGLAAACAAQGQDLFYPPNVKGWDGGRRWLNSTTLLARGNWVNDVIWGNPRQGIRAWTPQVSAVHPNAATAEAVTAFIELFFQDSLDVESRNQVLQAASDNRPESLRMALQLLLHCPAFQLC